MDEIAERHQYCPDETGLCRHDARGLSHECPASPQGAQEGETPQEERERIEREHGSLSPEMMEHLRRLRAPSSCAGAIRPVSAPPRAGHTDVADADRSDAERRNDELNRLSGPGIRKA